ncbi:YoaK family protein [Massilia terrae]|uniref:DUF1275 domain-containing protein n=1 Tax=Massilia terrae TaxID=1811224 RepID=A0ABT2D2T1_9BURK|nr:YoaK family protein [Massilia terrae]MCS0660340.1 DUF1275 domain-containing protein [Massilia terrae]
MLNVLREKRNSLALSFVSGYADALFFIQLGGLFVGLVTGNVVLIGLGLVGDEKGGLRGLQVLTFPLFMLGAGVAACIVARINPLERATFWTVILAAVLMASAAFFALFNGPTSACALVTVTAMGMLTGINRLDTRLGPPFSLMTGNIAGLAIGVARRLIGYSEKPEEWGQSLTSIVLVCGFVLGCAAGALAQVTVGVAGMLVPALILVLLGLFYAPNKAAK